MGNKGYNFIMKIPVLFRCAVFLRRIKMLPAERIIPKQSKKIEKLNMVSNSFAQKTINAHTAANTLNDVQSTSVFIFLRPNDAGKIRSSLMAAITLGLLISKTFT